ncbi:MAG: NADH-quinone oxidoreductase subunit H [Lachnospiraceae bacterium]|nr:NADH-quinone oxidoreductase subunit H [Lachnospiraceae bacterium]
MRDFLWLIMIILYLGLAPVLGVLASGYDRVVTARMQGRQGPPFLQPYYDIMKLFQKEAIVVNWLQTAMVVSFLMFTIFTGCLFFAGGDILLVFFAHSLAEVLLILAACSANSPYSNLGAQREYIQMMAYEPMTLLVAIGFYLVCGSFNVADIIQINMPAIIKLPGFFIGYCFILIIKFRKSPFDLSTSHHAHQEMVKGLTQDISGNVLGIMELGELYENVLLVGILALFFITREPWTWLLAAVCCSVVYFLIILIDNIFPRVKWEVMFKYTWLVTFGFAGSNFLILMMLRR